MSETKTAWQVMEDAIYESLFGDGKPTSDGTLSPSKSTSAAGRKAYTAAAQAVIAHHEATRPAWPPMRPMSDSDLANHVDILLAYEREREPGFKRTHIEIARQTLRGYWTTATYHAPFQQCVGWWPLPEVQQ